MTVIPAIDLRGGRVVRLTQGDFARQTVYSDDPLALARTFAEEGASRIHVVDLEGALGGRPAETALITDLVRSAAARFQVGGGIRDAKTVDRYLAAGAWRVVVGTRAALDAGFLKEVLGAFGESVLIGVDASKGKIATDGWTRVTDLAADVLIERVLKEGGREIIYTDIAKDGTLEGPNLAEIARILKTFRIRVVASGGVRDLEDVKALLKLGSPNLTGVIVGKAIYEGTLKLKEALALC